MSHKSLSLDERLSKQPQLKEQVLRLLEVAESNQIVRAGDAEEAVINGVRGLGREILQEWAYHQEQTQREALQNNDSVRPHQKKELHWTSSPVQRSRPTSRDTRNRHSLRKGRLGEYCPFGSGAGGGKNDAPPQQLDNTPCGSCQRKHAIKKTMMGAVLLLSLKREGIKMFQSPHGCSQPIRYMLNNGPGSSPGLFLATPVFRTRGLSHRRS